MYFQNELFLVKNKFVINELIRNCTATMITAKISCLVLVIFVACCVESAIYTEEDHEIYLENVKLITRYMNKSSIVTKPNNTLTREQAYQQDHLTRLQSITFFMEIIYEAKEQLQLINYRDFASRFSWFSVMKQAEAANDTISNLMMLDGNTISTIYTPYDYSESLNSFKQYYSFFNPKYSANQTEELVKHALETKNTVAINDVLVRLDDMIQQARRSAAQAELSWLQEKDNTLNRNTMPAIELQYFLQYIRGLGHSMNTIIDPYIGLLSNTLGEIQAQALLEDKKNALNKFTSNLSFLPSQTKVSDLDKVSSLFVPTKQNVSSTTLQQKSPVLPATHMSTIESLSTDYKD